MTCHVMVTGAAGFMGRNLCVRLGETGRHTVLKVTRATSADELHAMAAKADVVIHLAGVNRPETEAEFAVGNADFTGTLCAALAGTGRAIPVIAASSIQAERDNPYGRSKRAGEAHLEAHAAATGAPVAIYRLVNVFGKWCRPQYNSVVGTFCHNIARDLPIQVNDPAAALQLIHVDDAIDCFLSWLDAPAPGLTRPVAGPVYDITLGALEETLRGFRAMRETHTAGPVGVGLGRALYATYVSYLPPADFAYPVKRHGDERGVFAEMLRTEQSGQFSFFTAGPGITRGGHYHHAKTEKFLVLKGHARFRFRQIDTGETHEIETRGDQSLVVETVPGWSHDITNIGTDELICMLWANELFDPNRPDTIAHSLEIE